MFVMLRQMVPLIKVLLYTVTVLGASSERALQFCEKETLNFESLNQVRFSLLNISIIICTEIYQSCFVQKMHQLSINQKKAIKNIYKIRRKLTYVECHVEFLKTELELGIIPKCFRIKCFLPGNKFNNTQRLDIVSIEAMRD